MSSIVIGANPERTNRWLLIGAAALALITGVLIFAAISQSGGGGGRQSRLAGDTSVLIANETIEPGTKLNAEMFRVATLPADDLVPNAVSEVSAVTGQTALVEVLKGQQLSRTHLGQVADDEYGKQLAFNIPAGMRAVAVKVTEDSAIGGLVVPGDRVDVVVTIKEKQSANSDQEYLRVSTVLQNIEVLARAQDPVERIVEVDEKGNPVSPDPDDPASVEGRPTDIEAEKNISTVTLALSKDDVHKLVQADALGDITLSGRAFGEDETRPVGDLTVPIYEN